jgi:hypothetical protein
MNSAKGFFGFATTVWRLHQTPGCSGGQYTNTGKSAQEKHFTPCFPSPVTAPSTASAAFYKLIQQKSRQPLLVVAHNSAMM